MDRSDGQNSICLGIQVSPLSCEIYFFFNLHCFHHDHFNMLPPHTPKNAFCYGYFVYKYFWVKHQQLFVFKGVVKGELHFCFLTLFICLLVYVQAVCFLLTDKRAHFNYWVFSGLEVQGMLSLVFAVILGTLSQKVPDK